MAVSSEQTTAIIGRVAGSLLSEILRSRNLYRLVRSQLAITAAANGRSRPHSRLHPLGCSPPDTVRAAEDAWHVRRKPWEELCRYGDNPAERSSPER